MDFEGSYLYEKENYISPSASAIKVIAYGTIYYQEGSWNTSAVLHRVDGGWDVVQGNLVQDQKVNFGGRGSGLGKVTKTIYPSGYTFSGDSGAKCATVGMTTTANVMRLGTTSSVELVLDIRS